MQLTYRHRQLSQGRNSSSTLADMHPKPMLQHQNQKICIILGRKPKKHVGTVHEDAALQRGCHTWWPL